MAKEVRVPTPQEILNGILDSGRRSQEVIDALGLVVSGVEKGQIRTEINCWEHVSNFFEMANRMYVKNEGIMLTDAELGIHEGSCDSPICNKLMRFYFEKLRPSQTEDGQKISTDLRTLAEEIMLGKPLPDLENKDSIHFDRETGKTIRITKAVDITDRCATDDEEVILSYMQFSNGPVVEIMYGDKECTMSQGFRINQDLLTNNDNGFRTKGALIGMDPELLYMIILANRPDSKDQALLK